MNHITVATKDMPPVLQVLLHKQTCEVVLTDSVTISQCDLEWSGGTRYEYALVELATGIVKPIKSAVTFGWKSGFVVVRTGVFCGKPTNGTVYANAVDVTPALPKPAPTLSHTQQQILKVLSCYNSKGKERFRQDMQIKREVWDVHINDFVNIGLCNKNGSLTIEGKNVARTIPNSIIW